MKIRMKTGSPIAGPDVVSLGRDHYELPDAQAAAVVAAGHADHVDAAGNVVAPPAPAPAPAPAKKARA